MRQVLVAMFALVSACGRRADRAPVDPAPIDDAATPSAALSASSPAGNVLIEEIAISSAGPTTVHVTWSAPKGTGVNADAPFHVRWRESDGLADVPPAMDARGAEVEAGFDVVLTPIAGVAGGRLGGDLNVVVCDVATHRVCVPVHRRIELPFRAESGGARRVPISVPLPEARP